MEILGIECKVEVDSLKDWHLNKANEVSRIVYNKLSYLKSVEVIIRGSKDG